MKVVIVILMLILSVRAYSQDTIWNQHYIDTVKTSRALIRQTDGTESIFKIAYLVVSYDMGYVTERKYVDGYEQTITTPVISNAKILVDGFFEVDNGPYEAILLKIKYRGNWVDASNEFKFNP